MTDQVVWQHFISLQWHCCHLDNLPTTEEWQQVPAVSGGQTTTRTKEIKWRIKIMHDGILIIENCKIQKAYYYDGLCKQKYCSSDKILERIG